MTPDRPIGPGSVLASAQEFGPESTPCRLILVHGSMDRQGAFARLCRSLPDIGCVTYDRRGYARSRDLVGPFDVLAHTSDLVQVLEACRSEGRRSAVVGHSFGGVVALAAASQRPDLVDGLVVYESPMSWEPWWSRNSGGAAALQSADRPELAAENFLRLFAMLFEGVAEEDDVFMASLTLVLVVLLPFDMRCARRSALGVVAALPHSRYCRGRSGDCTG